MGEVVEIIDSKPEFFLHQHSKSSDSMQVMTITTMEEGSGGAGEANPQDAWLPITESRKGSIYSSMFHIMCSGLGIQGLVLPVAFGTLGWEWGIICMSAAFVWQLYTTWLLVHLHESIPGTRYSRYLHLSIAAFGGKLGKLLAIFPVMYLSGGTCVMLIITGGGTLHLFFKIICDGGVHCAANSITGVVWFLLFTCMAIAIAQFPNLNSISWVSLIGAVTAVGYCTLIWVLSICKGRPTGVSYGPSESPKSQVAIIMGVLNALGIVALAFRGHNLVLEIQGTLPSSPKHPSHKLMWRGVTMSYLPIAMCLCPLAIGGYWAYGNKIEATGGMLNALSEFHGHKTSKFVMSITYLLILINCLSSFQIFAMPVFDNLEFTYTSAKRKRCSRWVRTGFRLLFGGVAFLVAVTFPFLGSLAALIGGMTLPLTYSYPCFFWILIKKPSPNGAVWWFNLGLGCFGIVLSVILVVAALWNLAEKGLNANFFKPH